VAGLAAAPPSPETLARDDAGGATVREAAAALRSWGFLARPDFPDRPGPSQLLVAIRARPTLAHYDPERIEYWLTVEGRGRPASLGIASRTPWTREYAWGTIRLADRLGVTNEYLSFGGSLAVDRIDDALVAVFTSPAPILRRGGHSQGWDAGAAELGAWFARLLIAVDYAPGFEAVLAGASPLARFAGFVTEVAERFRGSATLRATNEPLWHLVSAEERHLRRAQPDVLDAGRELVYLARPANR
jgi:hypothetical protein